MVIKDVPGPSRSAERRGTILVLILSWPALAAVSIDGQSFSKTHAFFRAYDVSCYYRLEYPGVHHEPFMRGVEIPVEAFFAE